MTLSGVHTPHRRDTRKWSDDYCTRTVLELEWQDLRRETDDSVVYSFAINHVKMGQNTPVTC